MADEKNTLKPEDYLKMYMYFQDRADDVKEAMFKTLTWTVGFAAALLGLIFANLIACDPAKAVMPLSVLVQVLSGAGLVICLYSWFMLHEAGKHISANWERANAFKKKVDGLSDLVDIIEGRKKHGWRAWTAKIWNQLSIIVYLFTIAYILTLAWSFLG